MARRHWIAGLLTVSLAINLLWAGVLLGRWSVGSTPPAPPMMWAFKGVDPETRAQLRPKLQATAAEIAPLRRAFRQSTREIRDIAAAEPLDEQALSSALEELREISQQYQVRVHRAALDVLPDLTRQQRLQVLRRVFAAGIEKPGRPPGSKHDAREPKHDRRP